MNNDDRGCGCIVVLIILCLFTQCNSIEHLKRNHKELEIRIEKLEQKDE